MLNQMRRMSPESEIPLLYGNYKPSGMPISIALCYQQEPSGFNHSGIKLREEQKMCITSQLSLNKYN